MAMRVMNLFGVGSALAVGVGRVSWFGPLDERGNSVPCTYVCTAVAAVHMTSWRMIVSNCLSCGKIAGRESMVLRRKALISISRSSSLDRPERDSWSWLCAGFALWMSELFAI